MSLLLAHRGYGSWHPIGFVGRRRSIHCIGITGSTRGNRSRLLELVYDRKGRARVQTKDKRKSGLAHDILVAAFVISEEHVGQDVIRDLGKPK